MRGRPDVTRQSRRVWKLGRILLLVAASVFTPATVKGAELERARITSLFPEAGPNLQIGPIAGEPPAADVRSGGELIGYVFSTQAVSRSVGYSGKPIDILVGLTPQGRISGASLVSHQEPILVIGIASEELGAFVAGLVGLDIRRAAVQRREDGDPKAGPDHVAGATISSVVMRDAVLRSARQVARSRGLLGGAAARVRIDRTSFEEKSFGTLISERAIARRTIGRGEVGKALAMPEPEPAALFIDLFAALLTPPMIGQNLLGQQNFERLTGEMAADENAILVAANGLYSFKGTAWRRTDVFDRIQLVQGSKTIRLRKEGHQRLDKLAALGAPDFREIGIFRLPNETGFDPASPWRLELLVTRDGGGGAVRATSFGLENFVPETLLLKPATSGQDPATRPQEVELWQQIWQDRKIEIAILACMLTLLAAILIFQDGLTRRLGLYRATRIGYLVATLVFLGLVSGAQLSVVNIVTFVQALLAGFEWEQFLLDPLIFILWSFVALSMLFWGRGVFCGWLCPFGALQELLNEGARKLGIRQIEVPWPVHERLWPIKYIAFLLILGVSLKSLRWAYQVAEVEPFKTAIILNFVRDWPYVLYALVLLAAGLFIERFYCRYLCPLGAGLAIPARLRLFEWLHRRPQCGRECRICETRCTVQAISPLGQITPNECIYCLQCQANYYDATTCPPLKRRAERRAGRHDAQALPIPDKESGHV